MLDQARGITLRLHAAIQAAGVELATIDRHLARAIREDPSLYWLRGEEPPHREKATIRQEDT
jgi:hypothetical protein